jgi:hypothetical protein
MTDATLSSLDAEGAALWHKVTRQYEASMRASVSVPIARRREVQQIARSIRDDAYEAIKQGERW